MILGGLRLALIYPDAIFGSTAIKNRKSYILYSIISLLIIPFHSALLQLKLHNIQLILRTNPKNKTFLLKKDKITCYKRNFAKVEIGLETIYQMAGLNLLLFLSKSSTSTYTDPVQLLEEQSTEGTQSFLGFEISKHTLRDIFEILGYISIGFSLLSCTRSHLNVLSTEREHFPFTSQCLAIMSTVIAISKKLLTIILFFTPTLGLFNLLNHWKAEQSKWVPTLIQNFVDEDGIIQFGNSPPIPWDLFDRWEKNNTETIQLDLGNNLYKDNPNYYLTPPHYSLYTILSLRESFFCFVGLSCLHLIVIILTKQKWSYAYNELSILELLIHGIENTNIPYNIRQWCGPNNGNSADHRKRMLSNRNEGIALIMVSCIFNVLHLGPLSILGNI